MHATPCPRPDASPRRLCHLWNPAVTSDGLTLDTPLGPVDLVALERAAAGRRTPTTPAERAYLLDLLADGLVTGRTLVAAGLGMSGRTLSALLDARLSGPGAAA